MENGLEDSPSGFVNSNEAGGIADFDTSQYPILPKKEIAERLRGNLRQLHMNKIIQPTPIPGIDEFAEEDECNFNWDCFKAFHRAALDRPCVKRFFILLLFIFTLCCLVWDPFKNQKLARVSQKIELVCHVTFTLYLIANLISWKDPSVFWIVLDMATIVCGFTAFGIEDHDVQRYFKAVRALRMLFLIKEIQILNEPATKLMTALAKIGNLLIPALFIIYIYAVVGLYTFSDFEYNKCRTPDNEFKTSDWTVYSDQVYLCGELTCPLVGGVQYECLNPIDFDVEPNEAQLINMTQGNGLMKYSNIFFAFLSTFKQTFVTGSSRLIILYKQVLNSAFVQIYFYSYIYLISYIYLNIFYSLIITAEWGNEESNNQQQELVPLADTKPVQALECENCSEGSEGGKKRQSRGLKMKATAKLMKPAIKIPNQEGGVSIDFDKKSEEDRGDLKLEKVKIRNVFDEISPSDQNFAPNILDSDSPTLFENFDENATLLSQYPIYYKRYVVVNNVLVLLCCLNLCLDFHGQDAKFKFVVDCIDFAFYLLFVVEMLGLVLLERVLLRRNEFWTKVEGLIAVVCSAGVIYEVVRAADWHDFFASQDLTADIFRSFKYLRIMILLINTPFFLETKLILTSIFRSLYNIKNVVLLWFVIVLFFGVVGFHLHSYKTKVDENGQLDMQNGQGFQISFDGTFNAVIFTLLTFYNEEWDYLMFQQYLGSGALLVIWQLISICVGLILFSKYFMALLMKELDTLIDEDFSKTQEIEDMMPSQNEETESDNSSKDMFISNKVEPDSSFQGEKKTVSFNPMSTKPILISKSRKSRKSASRHDPDAPDEKSPCAKRVLALTKRLVEHKVYKGVFVVFILCSCLVLIEMNPHVDRNSEAVKPYVILDYICKGFFLLDLVLELMVYGLFQSETAYLRKSRLNWLNVVIIIVEVLSFTALKNSVVFIKIEKINALRVVWFIELRYKYDWGMRMTYHSFIQLLPKVFTLLFVTILMYSYFALVLVKSYKNDFYNCLNHDSSAAIVTKNDCLIWGGDWVQQSMNTANLFNSVLFLFSVATMEGWISLLQPMMNLAGPDNEPIVDNNKYICIFIAFFFFFGNLIMLNVFVGLSVSNFKRLKDITTGEARLSKIQRTWLNVKSQIYRLHPLILQERPNNALRGLAYDIAVHSSYKVIQGILFLGFLVSMSLFKTNMSSLERRALDRVQQVYVAVLILEYMIEFMAFGVRTEYKRSFIFKNVVVAYCTIFVILDLTIEIDKRTNRTFGGIFIALQFFRYLSLLDEIPFAKKMLNSLVTVLPQTTNIALIIFVTLFIYAIIGMELFSFLRPNIELDTFNQNYTNFSSALFALIKFSTMESPIQQISDAAQTLSPNFVCVDIYSYESYQMYGQNGCGNKFMSYLFFLSFHIFYSLLLMSTLMAVIVDSYSEVKKEESAPITKLVLERVRSAWSQIDPEATGYIPYREFWMFTAKLLEIYVGKDNKKKAQESLSELYAGREDLLKSLQIPIYENQNGVLCFQFHEVIEALTRIFLEKSLGTRIKSKKAEKMFKERQSGLGTGFKKSFYTSSHVATLIVLKAGLRWWKKVATNEKGKMEYKYIFDKFAQKEKEGKEETPEVNGPHK